MHTEVELCGHRGAWVFRGSRRLESWLAGRPWSRAGGIIELRLAPGGEGQWLCRWIEGRIRALDAGCTPVCFYHLEGASTHDGLLAALSRQLGFDPTPQLARHKLTEHILDACRGRHWVLLLEPRDADRQGRLLREAQRLAEAAQKADHPGCLVVCMVSLGPVATQEQFDFTTGLPADPVLTALADQATVALWQPYLHVRLAWESAGDMGQAQAWEVSLNEVGVEDDGALERWLNDSADKRFHGLEADSRQQVKAVVETQVCGGERPSLNQLDRLMAERLFWQPPDDSTPRPSPWAARALLRNGIDGDCRPLLRHCLVCRPLVRELLGRCFDIEAHGRALIEAQCGRFPMDDHCQRKLEKFQQNRLAPPRCFYPEGHPSLPDLPSQFAALGDFLGEVGKHRTPNYMDSLREIRNALVHDHYVSWKTILALREVELRWRDG